MTRGQISTLLLDLALIIVLARLLGEAARRLGQPAVIGEVVAGILLGPTLFHGTLSRAVFPAEVRPLLVALADVGIAIFMLQVGLRLEHGLLRGRSRIVASVSLGSMLLPFALGAGLAALLAGRHAPGHRAGFVLFLGAAMSVTAFPVLARILTDRGMGRTALGSIALACAAVADVLAWSLLALVTALVNGVGDGRLLLLPPYALVLCFVVRPLAGRLLANVPDGRGGTTLALAGGLASAAVTEWAGLHFIFGAFLWGAVLPRTPAGTDALVEQTGRVSAVLMPVFFVVSGLAVDLSGLGLGGLAELAAILLVAITGKFGGTYLAARLNRRPAREAATLGVLMNTRGLTEMVILGVGLQLGVLDGRLFTLMVVMAVVTTAMTGPLLTRIYPPDEVERDVTAAAGAGLARPVG